MSKKNFLSVKCFLHFYFFCVFFKNFSFLSLRTTNDINREEVGDIYNRAAVDLVGLFRERKGERESYSIRSGAAVICSL